MNKKQSYVAATDIHIYRKFSHRNLRKINKTGWSEINFGKENELNNNLLSESEIPLWNYQN